jgi:hypothetical protein
MLYMFQAVSPPIIRRAKTIHTAPDDGWRNHLKHVEH